MDVIALAALVLSTAMSMLLVPDLHAGDLVEPTIQAALLTPFVLTALLAFRVTGTPPVWERRLLALFLLLNADGVPGLAGTPRRRSRVARDRNCRTAGVRDPGHCRSARIGLAAGVRYRGAWGPVGS